MAHIRTLRRVDGGESFEVRWRNDSRFHQRTFRNREQARAYAGQVTRQTQPHPVRAPAPVTVRDAVEASLRASQHRLKPRTVAGYRSSYTHHILPAFRDRLLTAVTVADIEDWLLSLTGSGLAPATVAHQHVALSRVFKYALRHRLVEANPCRGAELPEPDEAFEPVLLLPGQVDALADHLDTTPPYGLIVRLTAYTGIRAGELAALRIRDVDLHAGLLQVRHSLGTLTDTGAGGDVLTTPKSARSIRRVPLRRCLVELLTAHLAEHAHADRPEAALWPGRSRGRHAGPDYTRRFSYSTFYRHHFKPALTELGLPDARFHDLRHFAAGLWLTAGVPIFEVSQWLGHANVAITDRTYGGLLRRDDSRHLRLVERYLPQAA